VKAKIIQIASTDTGLYALASDGTIWEKYVGEWVEVDQPPLADPEDGAKAVGPLAPAQKPKPPNPQTTKAALERGPVIPFQESASS
jgi:hypothetical protein